MQKEKKGAKSTPQTDTIITHSERLFKRLSAPCEEFCEPLFVLVCFDEGIKGYPQLWTGSNSIPQDKNIYYGINPRASLPAVGQGRKEDISYVVAFFADIDVGTVGHKKDTAFQTIEEAKKHLAKFHLRPSLLIKSGHGLQALWILTEAAELGKDIDLDEYEAINRGIQNLLGADTTPQVNMVFRLPGGINCKQDQEGNPLPRVAVEILEENDISYLLSDFENVQRIYHSSGENAYEAAYTIEKVDGRKLNPRMKSLLKGVDLEEPGLNDRSALIHRAIFGLAFGGFSDNQIFTLLTDPKNKLSEKILEKKNTKEQMRYVQRSIIKAREQIAQKKEQEAAQAEEVVRTLNVLGYTEARELIFWHEGKIIPIKIKELGSRDLKLLTGNTFGDELPMIINDLIDKARQKGLVDLTQRVGIGLWKIDGQLFAISGKKAYVVGGAGFAEKTTPTIDGKIIDFSEDWLDVKEAQEGFAAGSLADVFEEVNSLVGQWNWKNPEEAPYISAFIMLAPFQQLMTWRPWVYILGRRNTGKTTFFDEAIEAIYPKLVKRLDKSTAYAIAQSVGNSGRILVLDEFEKDRKIPEILEILKMCNRGGHKTSGTTGSKARDFNLFHLPFLGSIYLPGEDAAQKSRFATFELSPHKGKGLTLTTLRERAKLGARIVGVVAKNWEKIEKLAAFFVEKANDFIGISDTRMVENFAYSKAIVEVAKMEKNGQLGLSTDFLTLPTSGTIEVEEDEAALIEAIFSSLIPVTEGKTRKEITVAQALIEEKYEVENYGIRYCTHNKLNYVAFSPVPIQRRLLKDSSFAGLNIREVLTRVKGAITGVNIVRIAGLQSKKTVLIPASELDLEYEYYTGEKTKSEEQS